MLGTAKDIQNGELLMKILKNAGIALIFVLSFSCLKLPRSDSASEAGIESLIKKMLADPTYKCIYIEKDAIDEVMNADGLVDSLLANRLLRTSVFFENYLKTLKVPEDSTQLLKHVCSKFPNVHLIEGYMKDVYYPQEFNGDNVVEDFSCQILVIRPLKPVVLTSSNKLLLTFQVLGACFLRDRTTGKLVAYSSDISEGIPDYWFVLVEMKDGQKQSIKIWKR